MIGLSFGDVLPAKDAQNNALLRAFIAAKYRLSDYTTRQVYGKGKERYYRNSMTAIVEEGSVVQIWGTCQDITDQQQTAEALLYNKERLDLALRGSHMGLWEWNVLTNQLFWSPQLKKMYGLKQNKRVTYEDYLAMLPADDRARTQKLIAKSLKTGQPYTMEHRVIWPDGTEHWILGQGKAYKESGQIVRMVGTALSIDRQKNIETTLQRQNAYLETLHITALDVSLGLKKHTHVLKTILERAGKINGTHDGYIYLKDPQTQKLVVRVGTGLFKEYVGHTINFGEGLAGRVWETGQPLTVPDYETWDKRQSSFPKGLVRTVIGMPLRTDEGVIGVMTLAHRYVNNDFDSEQMAALSRLADLASVSLRNARVLEDVKESEQRFRTMADTAPVMIWLSGADRQVTYCNKSWLEFTGQAAAGKCSAEWTGNVHPDDVAKYQKTYETAFDSQQSFSVEYRLRRHDGEYRWILDVGRPRFSPEGKFVGYIGSGTDIHDLKRASELILANSQLKNQRRQLIALNKAKDDFVALASHQLRTPATAVKQYISLLINDYAGPVTPDQLQYLQIAYNSNERQLKIINDLLKTAQLDSSRFALDMEPHDIARIITAAVDELEITVELKNQRIVLRDISSETIEIDETEMKLVLVNLLENASKYSYPHSEIVVTMQKQDGFLEIAIRDKGVGISRENKQRIFDKFTRIDNDLSDTVSGSGLGLYWVKRIVAMHGGNIKVNSALSKGSTFTIRLPL